MQYTAAIQESMNTVVQEQNTVHRIKNIIHNIMDIKSALYVFTYNRSTEAIIRQARQDFLPEFDVTAEDSTTFLQVR